MSERARAIKRLYDMGRITLEGVRKALAAGVISQEEFEMITGVF